MKILNIVALLWSFGAFTGQVFAIGLSEVSIQELSSSEKSIVIDRGSLEKFTEGSYGKFFIQTGDFKYPKIFMVAEGKLVKDFPKKSYWYLDKVHLPKFIVPGTHLLVLTSEDVKAGRTIKMKQRHVVVPADEFNSSSEYLDKNKTNVPERLLQDAKDYEESAELYETRKVPEADLSIQSYEGWKRKAGVRFSDAYNDETEEKYFIGNREVKVGDIENEEDKKLLDSIADGYVEKINSQKYGLENGLYRKQKKVPGFRDLNADITVTSAYDEAREDKKAAEIINPRAVAKIKRDGVAWSEDMDDEALRRYFIQTGMEQESRRRDLALNELDGNEIMFNYSGSMTDHSSSVDEQYRNLGFVLGFGYDWHLSRASTELKNWSIQAVVDFGTTDYDVGGQNARGQEFFYGAYINYYLVNNPLTLNSFIWLAGVGLKSGSVKMQSVEFANEYSYQALTLPALQLMTKYRFRSGDLTEETVNVGASFNAGIQIDSKRLSVIEPAADNINGKISVTDIKYMLGMSVYF
ncbi:MAG: hypothetical protein WC635_15130 [Bacteriovorax sp.]|jgi:hypothetical protein